MKTNKTLNLERKKNEENSKKNQAKQ